MKITYNAPVVLTFFLLSLLVVILDAGLESNKFLDFFSTTGDLDVLSPIFYIGLFTHVIGHISVNHFVGNFMIILLVGPLLEARVGSKDLLTMIAITAVMTGILNTVLFRTGLIGASGIAFMMLILASCGNMRRSEIPLTLIFAALLYLGREIAESLGHDNVSQFGHILGGCFGIAFGLLWHPTPDPKALSTTS